MDCNCGVEGAEPGYHLFTCPSSGDDYEGDTTEDGYEFVMEGNPTMDAPSARD